MDNNEMYSGFYNFLIYFFKPFESILSKQQYQILLCGVAQTLFVIFIAAIVSAMFGAFGYLLGTKRGGKRG